MVQLLKPLDIMESAVLYVYSITQKSLPWLLNHWSWNSENRGFTTLPLYQKDFMGDMGRNVLNTLHCKYK